VVCGASGDNRTVVNVGRQGSEAPRFCQMEEGKDVNCRQDGGQRGALGGAMVEDNLWEGFAIKGQRDLTIRKEGSDPIAQGQGEA